MASRSLGTLTLDLIAKIGGFEQGMDRAARTADRKGREISAAARKRAKETEEAWASVGTAIGAVFSSIAVGAVFQKFIAETKQAEQEQAQLQAVLKSTGNAAGYSQERLNQMADAMQQSLGVAAGDVNSAQTVLLAFTNIVGEKFPAALQAAADHAARTGSTIQASAEIMGRALDVPSVGMASLQKQGFKFSESQIEVARELERTGQIAEAQQIVLDALNESYGGAAAAARNTFGGALGALQNTINDLLTGDSGSMAQMKESVEGLNAILASAETRAAFQTLIGLVTDVASAAINAATHFINFGRFAGESLAKFVHGSADPIERLDGMLSGSREELAALDKELSRPRSFSAGGGYASTDELQKRADMLRNQIKGFEQSRADLIRAANNMAPVASDDTKPDLKPRAPGIVNLKDGDKKGRTGKSQAEKDAEAAAKAAAAYIQQLHDQLGKVNELTAAERVLYDLQLGKVELTHAQKDIALGLAQEIDATKELEKQRARDLAAAQSQTSAQRELNDTLAQYARALDGFGMGRAEQERLAAISQITDKYTADIRRLDDERRSAQFGGKWTAQAQQQYDDELRMIGEFQQKALASYDAYHEQLKAKQGDWSLGAQSALRNYADESANVFAQTESMVTKAFGGMEDALVQFATTGKLDFKSLANSIIADLIRIQIRAAAVSFLSSMFGGLSFGGWSSAGVQASGAVTAPVSGWGSVSGTNLPKLSSGGYTGPGGKYQPAGIVHAGEVVWSQDDIRRAGGVSVVEAMRRGGRGYADGGVVALERPPAVASRGAAAASAGLNITTHVNVEGGGQASPGGGATEAQGRALSAMVTQTVREVVAKENRQGGVLWKMRNGY
jgi:lambda family phage tail tape measure protein